jgi:hypothetical protein
MRTEIPRSLGFEPGMAGMGLWPHALATAACRRKYWSIIVIFVGGGGGRPLNQVESTMRNYTSTTNHTLANVPNESASHSSKIVTIFESFSCMSL